MRYFITVVLFKVILIGGIFGAIYDGLYNVDIGVEVNTFYEATKTPSVIRCAMRCNTSVSCQTATFDAETKECRLSTDTRTYAIDTGNSSRKTISAVQDTPMCTEPPLVSNGTLDITTATLLDATASLQCNPGYAKTATSPLSVNCVEGTGWGDISLMVCLKIGSDPRGYQGTSFMLGFMLNGGEFNTGIPTLLFACNGTASVRVEIPWLLVDKIYVVASSLSVEIDISTVLTNSHTIEQKVVYITSNIPITVYSFSFHPRSADGTLILPIPKLSTEYYIAGYPSSGISTDEILLITHYDTTTVIIEYANTQQMITLDANETFLYQAWNLSGARITASKPLFVLSGQNCAMIPDMSAYYCDYIDEVSPPLTSLGKKHIVSFMTPRPDFTINVVTVESMTTVTFYLGSGAILETLAGLAAKTSIIRTYTVSKTMVIISDKPIMIHQYGHGGWNISGDPSMMFIPDIEHYGDQYEFMVPATSILPTLTVIIDNIYSTSELKLNGKNFNPVATITANVPDVGIFTVLYVEVPNGFNTLTHDSGIARFGAWLYDRSIAREYALTLGYAV
ncbi:hypothetical protein ACF0H5_020215 [Mactra antiquata]